MKQKLFIFTLFAVILTLAVVSAADLTLNVISVQSSTLPDRTVPVAFNITNTGNANYSSISFSQSSTNIGTWSLPAPISLNVGETRVLTANIVVPKFASGTVNAVLLAKNDTTQTSIPITIQITHTPALSSSIINAPKINQTGTVNITNTGNVVLSNINISVSGLPATVSPTSLQLAPGLSNVVDVTLTNTANLKFGSTTVTITA